MDEELKITVIDDKAREDEAEVLCKWAAARAGVIVVAPLLGTMALIANQIYMIIQLGITYFIRQIQHEKRCWLEFIHS